MPSSRAGLKQNSDLLTLFVKDFQLYVAPQRLCRLRRLGNAAVGRLVDQSTASRLPHPRRVARLQAGEMAARQAVAAPTVQPDLHTASR